MQNIYLGRQPILDLDGNLNSYEILYRDGGATHTIESNQHVSASVVDNILNRFGTQAILGNRKAFIKVDEKFLMSDLIFVIPKEFFIFSMVHVDINDKVIERFEELKKLGYTLAVNDIAINKESIGQYINVLETISYIKIEFNEDFKEDSYIENIVTLLKKNNVEVIATKIETDEKYQLAKKLGCKLFQGYYFSKPQILENTKYSASKANILKLYTLLMEEASIDDITKEFENNHVVTLQLLQYINSGAFHFRNKISSIRHVLTLVGNKPLAQWLILIMYSNTASSNIEVSPLMLMVKNRTELMESVIEDIFPDARANGTLGQVYFVGVLSLIDTVFGVKLEKILEDMNVDKEVKDALLEYKGLLGDVYALIKDIESFNIVGISKFVKRYNFDQKKITEISLKSMKAVSSFEESMKSTKG